MSKPIRLFKIRGIVLVGAGAVLVVAIVALAILFHGASQEKFRFSWSEGQQYNYIVSYETENLTSLGVEGSTAGPSRFAGSAKLEAQVALRAYERRGAHTLLGLAVEKVSDGRLQAMDTEIASDAAAMATLLEGVEAMLEVGSDGRVQSLKLDPKLSSSQSGLMQSLVASLEVVVLSGRSSWTALQDNPLGKVRQRYEWSAASRDLQLKRSLESYERVFAIDSGSSELLGKASGTATASLDPRGYLTSLLAEESVALENESGSSAVESRSRVEVNFLSMTALPSSALASLRARLKNSVLRGLSEIAVDSETIKTSLVQRAGGMTPQSMVRDITTYGGNTMPFHTQWVWRATGALRLYPEAARELADLFEKSETSSMERSMIIDLLVAASVPSTEAVLCDLLASERNQAMPAYNDWLQRVGLQSAPTKRSADVLLSVYEGAANLGDRAESARLAAAVGLGGVAGKLLDQGDDAAAERATGKLNEWLANAKSDESRAAYLLALGNTHDEEQVRVIADHAASDSPQVRRSCATALSNIVSPESESALTQLVSDSDPLVQYQALIGMAGQERSPRAIGAVADALGNGQLDRDARGLAVNLLMSSLDRGGEGSEPARSVLAQLVNQDIPARLRYAITNAL